MMAIRDVQVVSVPVSDQTRAKQFYVETLGFEVVADHPMGPEQRWVQVAPPGATVSLTLVTWFPTMPPGSLKGTVLLSDDVEGDYDRLTAHGVVVEKGIERAAWGAYFVFDDPDGNNLIIQQKAAEGEVMKKVRSRDGTSIAFDQSGNGPALILVDGALCSRAFGPMGSLAALLAPHFTVFTYDRRGRGDSGDTQPYAVEREVEDIAALIEKAGGSAFVYGISSGAALAITAASILPSITKLALYEPPFSADESAPRPPEDYVPQLAARIAAGRPGDAVELFMQVVGTPDEAIAQMRHAPMWPMLEAVAPTLVYDGIIMDGFVVPTARAAAIGVPTLVMDGGASPAWMRHTGQAVADGIPGAQHRTLEGQTHDVAAEVIAPALVEFFTD
jgi:pimeloyl-ACP methyl ester carboxylesterase